MPLDSGSPPGVDLPRYLEILRSACPDLPIRSARLNSSGQYNVVVMVDADASADAYESTDSSASADAGEPADAPAQWIFRFPRYPQGVSELAAETRLLRRLRERLRERLPLPIPDPVYARFDPPAPGQAFMGYRRLPGEPFSRAAAAAAASDPAALERMAGQLAGFLRALHGLSPATLGLDLPLAEQPADWQALYAGVRDKLFPAMRPDARAEIERLFAGQAPRSFTPCLRHGDFGGSNILFDPSAGQVTGVIDFSSCALGDPAMDVASLSTVQQPALMAAFLRAYTADPAQREQIERRAAFYRRTFALMEALAGFENGDEQAYRSGMAASI